MKRAEGRESFVAAGLALVVLVIVFLGLWLFISGKIEVAKWLPDFLSKQERVTGVEKVRYELLTNEVRYFDGTEWKEFKDDPIYLNEKVVIRQELTQDFADYYYSKDLRATLEKRIPLRVGAEMAIYAGESKEFLAGLPFLDGWIIEIIKGGGGEETSRGFLGLFSTSSVYRGGEVLVRLYSQAREQGHDERVFGEIVVGLDDMVRLRKVAYINGRYILKDSFEKHKIAAVGDYTVIVRNVVAWRDSVLDKPFTITYHEPAEKALGAMRSVSVCAEKYGTTLIVDLTQERTVCGASG